ncbi:MAG: LysM peptidoglycan-binding domain-containing protein, partial [Bacteroidota bacterium]
HLEWSGDTFHKDDDAKDECFRKYKNPEASFDDHSSFLTTRDRYSFLFDYEVTEYKKWARGLKKAGYATNPRYPQLLIGLIERHNLDKYDTMSLAEAKKRQEEKPKAVAHKKKKATKAEQKQSTTKEKKFENVKEPGKSYVSNNELLVKRNNRIKYVIARKGDTPEKIAEELDMWTWQIKKYNELDDDREIKPGMIVYLQPKRRKGSEKHHTVKEGENMYSISQKYGIKLKHIYRKNHMERGTEPEPGQKLWLRKKKPEH